MDFSIITVYPKWLILFCLILAAIYSYFFYNKDRRLSETPIMITRSMMALRFIAVFFLSALLLQPLIRTITNRIEKPLIIFAQDNSESIVLNQDSVFYKTEYLDKIKKLEENIAEKYEFKKYTFGEKVNKENAIDFNDTHTDFSSLFDDLSVIFSNRNVGAVIVASDGIYNKGKNPMYMTSDIKMPVHTIALGDSATKPDLMLKKITSNRIAFLGNKFPVRIQCNAKQLKGKKTKLSVYESGKELYNKEVNIDKNIFSANIEIELEATETGTRHYKVIFDKVEGENNTRNNKGDLIIDVIDQRQKILIVTNSPHPDAGMLKSILEANRNFEVDYFTINKFTGKAEDYNLIILNQLPSVSHSASDLLSTIFEKNIPVVFIVGNQTELSKLSNLRLGLKTNATKGKTDEAKAIYNRKFPLFELNEDIESLISEAPPLTVPFGEYSVGATTETLFNQNISGIETDKPLILFKPKDLANENKIGFIMGEGIWRWRMYDYLLHNNHDLLNELVNKIVQYMALREKKENIVLDYNIVSSENEPILFNAEIYNDSYEPAKNATVDIVIQDTNGKEFKYNFSSNNSDGNWVLNAGIFPEGDYTFNATAQLGEKKYRKQGRFIVIPINMEATKTTANFKTLYQLSDQTGGSFFSLTQIDELENKILNDENIAAISYQEKSLEDIINLKWIFVLLLTLISVEWFMRKYFGSY